MTAKATTVRARAILDDAAERPLLAALYRGRWMIAARGGLAVLLAAALLRWPPATLPTVVLLFAAYAIADGILALAAVLRTRARLSEVRVVWPVALEGVVSVAIGTLALVWPLRVTSELVYLLAAWGVGTGALELVAASHVSWKRAAHWLLLTGGASSIFLGLLIALIPYADVARTVEIMGVYALVFGAVLGAAAWAFPGDDRLRRAILQGDGGRR